MAETSEKSFPFDAEVVDGEYDRTYVADDFAQYFRAFISSGTFMASSTNLQVIANGDMTVTLKAGGMMINGYRYENESDLTITISPADGVLDRIDRISVTWSLEDRDIHYTVQEGTSSYSPSAPVCRRTAEYKDYVVADIYVEAGAISIGQEDITDQRLNSDVCGLATPFYEVDTTTIFNQFEAWFTEISEKGDSSMEELASKFETWFEELSTNGDTSVEELIDAFTAWIAALEEDEKSQCESLVEEMKNLLDDSAAGALQLEIDELQSEIGTLSELDTENQSSLVAAVNETLAGKWLAGTLVAGETSLSLYDEGVKLSDASCFDVYTDVYGVNPTAAELYENGEDYGITFTFDAQESDINVKVRVS